MPSISAMNALVSAVSEKADPTMDMKRGTESGDEDDSVVSSGRVPEGGGIVAAKFNGPLRREEVVNKAQG